MVVKYKKLCDEGIIILKSPSKILFKIYYSGNYGLKNYYYLATKNNMRCSRIRIVKKTNLKHVITMLHHENGRFKNKNN